ARRRHDVYGGSRSRPARPGDGAAPWNGRVDGGDCRDRLPRRVANANPRLRGRVHRNDLLVCSVRLQPDHFGGIMVLTKAELLTSLQKESRILGHLSDKVDPSMVD